MKERQICQKGAFHLKIKTYKKKLCVQNRVFEYKILKVLEKNREVICNFRAIQ